MKARYQVTIYQQNWRSNAVSLLVIASNAAEAKQKAIALAPKIHAPIVKITSIEETQ